MPPPPPPPRFTQRASLRPLPHRLSPLPAPRSPAPLPAPWPRSMLRGVVRCEVAALTGRRRAAAPEWEEGGREGGTGRRRAAAPECALRAPVGPFETVRLLRDSKMTQVALCHYIKRPVLHYDKSKMTLALRRLESDPCALPAARPTHTTHRRPRRRAAAPLSRLLPAGPARSVPLPGRPRAAARSGAAGSFTGPSCYGAGNWPVSLRGGHSRARVRACSPARQAPGGQVALAEPAGGGRGVKARGVAEAQKEDGGEVGGAG